MQYQLMKIAEALATIDNLRVYHYWRPRMEPPFCVWEETGEGESFHSSNKKQEQVIAGNIDYYTLIEFDPMVEEIQNRLNEIDSLGWSLDSVLYEDGTNLIHFSWSFQIS